MTDDQIAAAFNEFSAAFRVTHGSLPFTPMDVFRAGIQAARYAAPVAAPIDLLSRLLADHQRIYPHHADMCALCQVATTAIAAAPVAAQERDKALEEAAQVCMVVATASEHAERKHGAYSCAGKIRALIASQPAQGERQRQPTEPVLFGGQRAWCAFKSKFCCATPIRCHESGNCANRA